MDSKALFVSDDGEIREMPAGEGKEQVTVWFEKPGPSFPIDPEALKEPVGIVHVRWHPIHRMPEYIRKAVRRLLEERDEARAELEELRQRMRSGWRLVEREGVDPRLSPIEDRGGG